MVKWKSRPACCTGTMRTVPRLNDGGLEVQQEVLHAEVGGVHHISSSLSAGTDKVWGYHTHCSRESLERHRSARHGACTSTAV